MRKKQYQKHPGSMRKSRGELSSILRSEIKDPRIGTMTSVTGAQVAPDLKTCRVYISVLGDERVKEETIRGLKSAEGYIRRMLARNLNLRNTPELTFVLDISPLNMGCICPN